MKSVFAFLKITAVSTLCILAMASCTAWQGSGIQREFSPFRSMDDVQHWNGIFGKPKPSVQFVSDNPKDYIGADGIATGIPSEHRIGWVISPWAPKAGLVDVRHFEEGQIVVCPYTGKPLRVPQDNQYEPVAVPPQQKMKQLKS